MLEDVTVLEPSLGEVRVRVRAASLSVRDLKILAGPFGRTPRRAIVPGSDVAERVDKVRPGVDGWAVGDRVVDLLFLGWDSGQPQPRLKLGLNASVVHRLDGSAGALGGVGDHPSKLRMPILPSKLNQDRRHHVLRQQCKVTNWPAYDASLRQRGSLTVWFTDKAVAAWAAEARTTCGGQAQCSPLAILTALTLRAVFRLVCRQAEGPLGSIVSLLGLSLEVPDHTTLSRHAATLDVPRPGNADAGTSGKQLHFLIDSTGLKLCGKGDWLLEKHGTATRRSWRMLHLGVYANAGRIVAATLTAKDVDDASQAGPLLDQVAGAVVSFIGDGGYDQNCVYNSVARRHPDADVVVPPRANALPSDTAEAAPTQRDGHVQHIAEHGHLMWQNASGCNKRARVEAAVNRWKQVIGDELHAHTDQRRATKVAIAVHALNRMLKLTARVASASADPERGWGQHLHAADPCTTLARATRVAASGAIMSQRREQHGRPL